MRQLIQRRLNNRTRARYRGQAAVEFAFVAVILFMILLGIVEVARVGLSQSDVNNAAREGAHYLALNPRASATNVLTTIQSTLVFVDPGTLQVSPPGDGCPSCVQANDCAISPQQSPCTDYIYQPATVAVTYTWTSLVPLLPGLNTGLTLTGQSTAQRER